jgi:multidrug efflux pump subunit AcrA (membrane-fusion protein)
MLSNSHSDSLPLVQDNEFLPPISPWTTFGSLFVVAAVALAIPLTAAIKYKTTVKAQAILRPVGELRIVQAATEGQVKHVLVKENQVIKKGDVIATIDDSRLQTKKSQLQSNIQQAKLQLVQMNAQISALNGQITAETDRMNRAVASAAAEISRRRRDYRDRQIISVADFDEAGANVRIAQEELQRAQVELMSAKATLRSTSATWKAAMSKRDRYQSVAQEGALSKGHLEEAQLGVDQQEQAVEAQKAAVEMQSQKIEQLQQAVEAAAARRQRSKAALKPSQAEVAIASEGLAQEKAGGRATLATLNREREGLIQQQIQIQKQLERDSRELQQVELELNQTSITATEGGIISMLNLRNPGQTVRPGEEIAQIVPSDAPLVIKAAISPQDISKIAKGQNVQMRVSACAYPDYGTLKGVVSQISKDTIKAQGNGATAEKISAAQTGGAVPAFYEVTVAPESRSLGQDKNQCAIQLGMEGRADIITREETVLKFLLRKARLIADL